MKERKVSAFQFKRISRDETGKPPQKPVESPSPAEKNAGDNSIITSDRDLLRSIGDKDSLQTTEEKIRVIDYVFKRDFGPMRICYGCGSQINGKHYVSHSRKKELFFCSGCQQSLPACENCGMPVKLAGPKLPTVYCSFCRMTKECDCCSARITSKDSYRVDHVKGCFCHSCFNDRDRCVVCQTVIIPEDGGFLAGGRLVCLSCHDRNISLTEARTLNAGVIHFLNKEFSISDIIDCPILLVNYNVINRPNLVPALSRFLRGSEKPVLAMYEGITREKAVAVSAYEYGKYIVNRLNPSVADGELKESFAIWVMAYVLREYGELDELSAVKKRIETDGILKSLMNIERLAGLGRVVEKLKLGEIGRK